MVLQVFKDKNSKIMCSDVVAAYIDVSESMSMHHQHMRFFAHTVQHAPVCHLLVHIALSWALSDRLVCSIYTDSCPPSPPPCTHASPSHPTSSPPALPVQRIKAFDKVSGMNAIQRLLPDVMSIAKAKDKTLMDFRSGKASTLPPLFCVPMLPKDNYDTVGVPTTNGAQALLDSLPIQDATMVGARHLGRCALISY